MHIRPGRGGSVLERRPDRYRGRATAAATAKPTQAPPSPTPTPTAAPSAATVPTTFTSKTYGYSLTGPAGWTPIQATAAWDGVSALSHDSA